MKKLLLLLMLPLLAITISSCEKEKEGVIFEKDYKMEYIRDETTVMTDVNVKIEYFNREPRMQITYAPNEALSSLEFRNDEFNQYDNKISFVRYIPNTMNPVMIGHFCTNEEKTSILEMFNVKEGVSTLVFTLKEVE